MLSRKIIEGQQLLSILSKASRGLWKFQLVGHDELVKGPIGALAGLGHPDLMECLFGPGLHDLQQAVEHVTRLVHPAALLAGVPVHLGQGPSRSPKLRLQSPVWVPW